jgi:hypothetical protein
MIFNFMRKSTLKTKEGILEALKHGVEILSEPLAANNFQKYDKLFLNKPYCPKSLRQSDLAVLFNRNVVMDAKSQIDQYLPIWNERLALIRKDRDPSRPLIALIVPDGQSMRTFLLTDVWDNLNSWADVVVLTTQMDITSLRQGEWIKRERILPIPSLKRMRIDMLLRYAHYRNSQGLTHKIFVKNMERSLPERTDKYSNMRQRIWKMSADFSTAEDYDVLYDFVMMAYGALYPMKMVCSMIKQLSPQAVINANAISYNARLWTRAAALEKINVGAFVISWDNISSKWLIDEFARKYFLWSNEMLDDFKMSLTKFDSREKVITGSPQFEPIIRKSYVMSRRAFFEKYHLRESIPLILYTTGSKTMFPAEPEFLIEILSRWKCEFYDRMQFMIRAHPKDRTVRYDEVKERFPEVPFTVAGANLSSGGDWVPDTGDIELLTNQMNHCDIVVNVASTMTLEGFAANKPTVNIGFDLGKVDSIHYPLKDYYNSRHYSDVVTSGSVKLARNYDEVFMHICTCLDDPLKDQLAREKIFLKKCAYPFDASKRIDRAIHEFVTYDAGKNIE